MSRKSRYGRPSRRQIWPQRPLLPVWGIWSLCLMTVIVSTRRRGRRSRYFNQLFYFLHCYLMLLYYFLIFHFVCLFLGQPLALGPDRMAGATALVARSNERQVISLLHAVVGQIYSPRCVNLISFFLSPTLSSGGPFTFILKRRSSKLSCLSAPSSNFSISTCCNLSVGPIASFLNCLGYCFFIYIYIYIYIDNIIYIYIFI